MVTIYLQEIIQDIALFTQTPKLNFYENLFSNLNLSDFPENFNKTGRKGYSKQALFCAFIVMKCECFSYITDLVDFLENNLLIAHYCGFNIMKKLPSYWTFDRFINNIDNNLISNLSKSIVLELFNKGILDASFISLDSTPIKANTSLNNPKSFKKNKFSKDNQPCSDKDCALGVHTATNQINERNYNFYWGYKNHVLIDCITGLPIFEMTTKANVADSSVTLDILNQTNSFLSLNECTFIADKGYDVKNVYNTIKNVYNGDCVIPLNTRNSKKVKTLSVGNPICDAGLAMHKDGKTSDNNRTRQKFCCPLKSSKTINCPCNHKNWNNGKKHKGCTKYITIPNDYRLSICRDSISFKKIYALRSESERYNARFKTSSNERIWVHSLKATQNLISITHFALLLVSFSAINSKNKTSYRAYKSLQRVA